MKAIFLFALLCFLATTAQAAAVQPVEKQDLIKCANDVIAVLKSVNNVISLLTAETIDPSALIAAALAVFNAAKKIPGDCFGST